jgi:hypothetical protein
MFRLSFFLTCFLMALPALASQQENGEPRPLVQVDVSFEMDAINESLHATSESIGEISDSFVVIAEGGQLYPEQQQQLVQIMENLDHLVEVTRTSVDALPTLVERSRGALTEQVGRFLRDLKFWAITLLVVLGVALILAIICFYYLVLSPMRRTLLEVTRNISDMARAMENTSKSLEISSETQRELLKLSAAPARSS